MHFSKLFGVAALFSTASALTIGHEARHWSLHQRRNGMAKQLEEVVKTSITHDNYDGSLLEERQFSNNSNYWLGNVQHQGIAAYNSPSYKVFRNVKDYGAKGTLQCL